jgi:hypothetical protein
MRTALEMYEFCLTNGYGKGFNEKTALGHFGVIENNLLPNEEVKMCIIGLLNFVSISKHDNNGAIVLTDKRLMFGQQKMFGVSGFKSIYLDKLNDLSKITNPLFTIITVDALKDTFNVALAKDFGNQAYAQLSQCLFDIKNVTPKVNDEDVSDQLRKLKALLDDGILTQNEFDAKKKSLLGL